MSTSNEAVEAAARAIYAEGAYCGNCEYAGWESCADCRDCCTSYARAAAPHMLARHAAALEAVSKALSDATAFGRQATHAEVLDAMRAELTP